MDVVCHRSSSRLLLVALLFAAPAAGVGCADPSSSSSSPDSDDSPVPAGATRGDLSVTIATFDDGSTTTDYVLDLGGGRSRRLIFGQDPNLSSGVKVDVWGDGDGDRIRVDHVQVVDTQSPFAHALRAGAPYGSRRLAFVLVDVDAKGVNLAAADATRKLFGMGASDGSLKEYYIEASYGRQDLAGDIIGPLPYAMAKDAAGAATCDTRGLATALRPMIPGTYDHYLWYLGSNVEACGWSGLASVGTPDRPQKDTWYNVSSGCVVLAQEPGHNFGMQHSSSMKCGTTASFVDAPDGVCTHSEYGDRFDPMGMGCRHMNSYQKSYQGWFGGCNQVEVKSSATFTLLPLELPCDGVQSLQIAMPKTRMFAREGGGGADSVDTLTHYYVELRTSRGLDNGLTPVVQIRVSGDTRNRSQRGLHSWILDMTPSTSAFDGLVAGGSFADPAGGVTVHVDAVDTNSATVTVTLAADTGPSLCLDDTTFQGPGPGMESCNAVPATIPSTGAGGAAGGTGAGGAGPSGAGGSPAGSGGATGAGGAVGPRADGGVGAVTSVNGCACDAGRTGAGRGGRGALVATAVALVGLARRRSRRR